MKFNRKHDFSPFLCKVQDDDEEKEKTLYSPIPMNTFREQNLGNFNNRISE